MLEEGVNDSAGKAAQQEHRADRAQPGPQHNRSVRRYPSVCDRMGPDIRRHAAHGLHHQLGRHTAERGEAGADPERGRPALRRRGAQEREGAFPEAEAAAQAARAHLPGLGPAVVRHAGPHLRRAGNRVLLGDRARTGAPARRVQRGVRGGPHLPAEGPVRPHRLDQRGGLRGARPRRERPLCSVDGGGRAEWWGAGRSSGRPPRAQRRVHGGLHPVRC
mmetsp:Transcript_27507/g.77811  ORF Transcript_27507/g.77811 Transcript_27507/m.77811 type:complete len:219 (+) Transcript_27507:224-880(+)